MVKNKKPGCIKTAGYGSTTQPGASLPQWPLAVVQRKKIPIDYSFYCKFLGHEGFVISKLSQSLI